MASRKPKPGKCGSALRSKPGWFCDKDPMDGVTRCRSHGGASPQTQAKRTEGKTRKALHALVTAIPEDDIEADPIRGYDVEYRKTVAAIRWLDEKVSSILEGDEDALIWGEAEKKFVGAGEWPGIDVTERAGLHMWEQMRRWEREHLLDLVKVYMAAKIGEGKVRMAARLADAVDEVIRLTAIGLGADPNSAQTRKVIQQAFEALGAKQNVQKEIEA